MSLDKNYYCTRKFSEIALHLENRTVSACCSAVPQKIDFVDLKNNGLLNLSCITQDRSQMINNVRVESCEVPCWLPEDNNLVSTRLLDPTNVQKKYSKSHITQLPTINLFLGSRCTMTCVYCNSTNSRAWAEDLSLGGYGLKGFSLTNKNKLIKLTNQSLLYSGQNFQELIKQLEDNKNLIGTWYIAGGEPFLYESQIIKLLEIIPLESELIILSGLGVPKNKFVRLIDMLKTRPKFKLGISAETLGSLYEFNRYGNSFQHFLTLLDYIKQSNVKYEFHSTLSNVTAFGYIDFVNFVDPRIDINQTICTTPSFLRPTNLDPESKIKILERIDKQNNTQFGALRQILESNDKSSDEDKMNLAQFLKEFALRRNLNLNIFPKTFLTWLNINVV